MHEITLEIFFSVLIRNYALVGNVAWLFEIRVVRNVVDDLPRRMLIARDYALFVKQVASKYANSAHTKVHSANALNNRDDDARP